MKSQILDRNGNNFEIKTTAPNLDPDFWYLSNKNTTVSDVLDKPYLLNHWIHSCVRSIAQNVAQVDRNIKNVKSDNIDNEHNVYKLLNKPNFLMDYYTFFFTIVCYLLLPAIKGKPESGGQCFIVPWNGLKDEPVRLDKGEIPDELMPFSEAFFKPWYGDSVRGLQQIKGWVFEIPNSPGSKTPFEFGQIINISMPNPYDMVKGMTPFASIAGVIETDTNADTFNNNLFLRQGRLDGVATSDQFIEQTELDKMREKFTKRHTGPNQERIAFLSGGLKYEQFGLSTMDLGYVDQQKWNRQKVLAAYGLNRIAVGDYEDINFATIREGSKLLWYDRYIPVDKLIVSAFNGQWILNIERGTYKLSSDYTNVPALQADMRERTTVAGDMCQKMAFPPELAARIMNIPIKKEDLEKWPHLSESVKQSSPFGGDGNVPQNLSIKKDIESYSREYIKSVLDPAERKFQNGLEKYFIKQRNKILDKIDELVKDEKSFVFEIIKVSGWQFLPDEAKETFELLGMHKEASKVQSALEKKQVENELGHNVDWDTSNTRIDYWTSLRAKYVRDINTVTFRNARDAINAMVKQGVDEGQTVSELRANIKQAVHDVYNVRIGKPIVPNGLFDLGGMSSSKTIARTEMGNIATLTRSDIFKSEGIEKIEWITAHDEKVRTTHSMCESEGPVSYGDTFKSNGLRYPRDPNGPPREVINCRCSFVAVIGD